LELCDDGKGIGRFPSNSKKLVYKARKPITRTSKAHERLVGMHDGRSYKRFAGKRAIKNPSEGKEKEMTQKKIDIVIKDKSNDYHIHFFITRDEAVFYAPNGVCGKHESRDVYPRYDGPEAAGQREDRGHGGIETASAAEYFEVDDGGAACDSGDNGSRVHGNDGICRRA